MSFQLILNLVFLKPRPLKQIVNKKEIFLADPHLGIIKLIKQFLATVPILYPLKTPEAFWFSGAFRRYKMGTLTRSESI